MFDGSERIFLDTLFVQALLNRRDRYHIQAKMLLPRIRAAQEVWLTEAIIVEIGNALAATNRVATSQFIRQCYQTANMQVVLRLQWSLLLGKGGAAVEQAEVARWSLQ